MGKFVSRRSLLELAAFGQIELQVRRDSPSREDKFEPVWTERDKLEHAQNGLPDVKERQMKRHVFWTAAVTVGLGLKD